jgi:hypothetical protein
MLADTWKDGSVVLVKGLSPASLYIVTLPTLPIVNAPPQNALPPPCHRDMGRSLVYYCFIPTKVINL